MKHISVVALRVGLVSIVLMAVLFFVFLFSSISGIPMGNSYLNGVVIDHDTRVPIPEVPVVVSNRGWGIVDGRLTWDRDYVYSAITDQLGRFNIVYQVGPSAHVIVTKDGYERFDDYFDRNTTVTIELKRRR